MEQDSHFPNAPIQEAIIDLRVVPKEGLSLSEVKDVPGEAEADRYPNREAATRAKIMLDSGEKSVETFGYKFTSADDRQVWRSESDGFAFSRLSPYDRWETFQNEANALWFNYRRKLHPKSVKRLAVRYINRIDIPAETIDVKDYFRTFPEISPELPQDLSGFFMQLAMPQRDLQSLALVRQALVPPTQPGITSVVLDIDIFRDTDVPQDDEDIWAFFAQLRGRKNAIFRGCLTERTLELFRHA